MSGRSWNHTVRVLSDDERGHAARRSCSTPRCSAPPTHATRYHYATARAGRAATAERMACAGHARAFAARHGVDVPTTPAPAPALATSPAVSATPIRSTR